MNEVELALKKFRWNIILGSASPRRQEILKSLGFTYRIHKINVDESDWPSSKKAEEICVYLAEKKAAAFFGPLKENDLLITSDTIVWCDGKVYNKPHDFNEGKSMLRSLSGRMHQVFTAVCLKSVDKQHTFFDMSRVYFKEFTDDEIEFYLLNYKPYDKAGAYGVQDWLGYVGIEKIEGSFYNVMGLPVKKLYEELMRF